MEPRHRRTLLVVAGAGWLVVGCSAFGSPAPATPEVAQAAVPAPAAPRAQADASTSLLKPGGRVRVHSTADDDEVEGVFVGADATTLRILDDEDVVTLKRQAIRRIEVVSAGPRPSNGKRVAIGSLIGAAAGLGAGGMTAYVLAGGVSGDPDYNAAPALLIGVAAGATVGGLIAHATRGPGWTELPLERVQVSIAPTRRGVHAALSIRF